MEGRDIRAVLPYLGLLTFGYALGIAAPAFAEPHPFAVPAQQADQALEELGSQGGLTVTFNPDLVKGHRTREVHGLMEPAAALKSMLQGSGLRFVAVDPTTFSVIPRVPRLHALLSSVKAAVTPPAQSTAELPRVDVVGHTDNDLLEPFGTSGARMSQQDRLNAGIFIASDWLLSQTANSGAAPSEWTRAGSTRDENTNSSFETAPNFHGLGAGDTLVLVNGRRLAPGGSFAGFTDVGSLPLSAVSDIVVLHDGSSPIYGTDAVGGIVNFVLNRIDTDTPESQARTSFLRIGSFGEKELSQSYGVPWDGGGGGLVTFEYYSHDALPAADRRLATSDYRQFGGPDLDIPFGSPGTIVDALTNAQWGIPHGQNGVGLAATSLIAGQPNLYDRNLDASLLPKERRINLVGTGEWDLSDDTNMYADVLLTRRWVWAQAPGQTGSLAVPTSNAFYIDNLANGDPIDVQYGFGNDVGPLTTHGRVDSGQLVLGFDRKVSSALSLQGYVSYASETQTFIEYNLINSTNLATALGQNQSGLAFNPFGDGTGTQQSVIDSIRTLGYWRLDSTYYYASLSARAALLPLAGGPLTAVLGFDARQQRFSTEVNPDNLLGTAPGVLRRTSKALYAELQAPVSRGGETPEHVGALGLSAGARLEHYTSLDTVFTPQFGATFVAAPGLTLQTNWARWFREPNLPDLSQRTNISAIFPLPDTSAPNGVSNVLVWSGSNSDLRPERAQSLNIGAMYNPVSVPNLALSLKYFDITVSDRIYQIDNLPLTALTDPQYSWLVTRDVTPAERAAACAGSAFVGGGPDCLTTPIAALVDIRLHNTQMLKTSGLDLSGHYQLDTHSGQYAFGLDGTYYLRYAQSDTPGAPIRSILNTAHNPMDLRLRGSFSWSRRGVTVSTYVNFENRYRDTDSPFPREVSAWTTYDFVIGTDVGDHKTQISFSALNVLNTRPPVVYSSYGLAYDEENANLLGRRVSLSIQHHW